MKATLILAIAGAAAFALARSAATRHLVWCIGLCASLALPLLDCVLPGWSSASLPTAGEEARPERNSKADVPAARLAESLPALSSPGEFRSDWDKRLGIPLSPAPHPDIHRRTRPWPRQVG